MKFKKNFKKGFTLVELIVVIAIVAILAAVSVVSYLAFINQANESADIQLVKQLNIALQADESLNGKRSTMHEMLGAMEDNGFVVENLTKTKSGYDIVWDQTNNRFALTKADNTLVYGESTYDSNVTHTTWKFVDNGDEANTATNQNYSIYLTEEFAKSGVTNLDVKAGLDVGNYSKLENISYNTTSNESVVIRTNGGKLTVNAPEKTVKHYGEAQIITLTEVGTNSYYEHGSVNLIDIKKGRLVITNDAEADVGTIYLSATGDAYDDIIIATQSGSKLPDVVARQSVSNPTTGEKKVVTIQTNVDANGQNPSKTEIINLYPSKDVKEEEDGYNVSDLGLLVVEAISEGGIAEATEQITDAAVLDSVKDSNVSTKEEVIAAATMFAGGKGTEEDPYLIDNILGLNNIDKKCNPESSDLTYFKLISDIVVSDEDLVSYSDYWGYSRSALFGKISNAVIDGNNHIITANISNATIFGDVRESKLCNLNVTINGTGASLIFYSENIDLLDITIDGQISWETGNCGAFIIYPRYNVTMANCINEAELSTTTGDTTMYCAVFFGYGFPNDSRIIMTNCSNKGSLTAGRASLLMANCAYGKGYIDYYLNFCSNDGQIISTSVNDDNNLLVSIISDKAYAYHFTIDGITYTTSTTTKWTDALPSSLLIGKGTFVKGSNDTLGITENTDGTFTITASNKSVAKYIVSVGVYTSTEIGSSRSYVTEEIPANGDNLVSTLKDLKFIDNAWIEANPTAQIDTLAGNTIYTIGDESFYLVNEPDRCNVGGTPKIAEMISVTAVDSQGRILSSASLEK